MNKAEEIQKANGALKSTDIKGKGYIEVNQRIKAFRQVYPTGTISTDIVSLENGVVMMKTTVLDDNGKTLATGLAYEKESSSFINKTSFIENCETSAIGRALGFCGFGIDSSVASAEEVENAILNQNKKGKQVGQGGSERKASPKQIEILKKTYKGENLEKLLKVNKISKIEDISLRKASELISEKIKKDKEKLEMSFDPRHEPWFNGKDF
ncbi:hypothetical protein phiLdb_00026 [Lactobacillus phage phiLdb]|uniref:Uncharacterized protein n=1 Tax=Lactobacillus phage phiLdb TaxID=1399942 RepID=U3PCT3_9CAUD|nr:hypothetical protein phiLdb_00026 [Lactobacillus phage phiLdb]AGW43703.1 hypothetical protein phiLdb_00026 [Lactobacillus phage phiLdb]